MPRLLRPILATVVTTLFAVSPALPTRPPVSSESELFVDPSFIVLPTYVAGDVARLRIIVQSRSDAPVEIEQIEIRDLRFTVRVPGGWSGSGIERVACDPPLRIEPRGSLALEFEANTRGRLFFPRGVLVRKTIVAKVRGNPEPIHLADVSARVVPGYSVKPGEVDFGEVRRGETPTREVVVEAQELGPFRILSIVPDERRPKGPFGISTDPGAGADASLRHVVTVKVDATAPVGLQSGAFDLETDSPQRVAIPLVARVRVRANLEVRLRGQVVDRDSQLELGELRLDAEPVEIDVRDTLPVSDWSPGDASLVVFPCGGADAVDPKLAIETIAGSTSAERRILVRLLERGSSTFPGVLGEIHLELRHADLDEIVLRWRAIVRDR